jgi:hypothetical protein
MGAPTGGVILRPLGIGEIIDRAVTLYLRNFVPLTATVLVVVFIPFSAGEYFLLDAQSGEFHAIFGILQHPGTQPTPEALQEMVSYPELFLGYLMIVATAVLGLFANNAVAVNVAAVYAGRAPDVTGSLRVTFRRWASLLGLLCLAFLIALSAYAILILVIVAGVVGVGGTAAAFPGALRSPLVVTILILLSVALFVAAVVAAALLILTFTFAGYAIVIEKKGVIEAVGSGFARIFNRNEWGRAVLILVVAFFIGVGISMVSGIGEMLLFFVPGGQIVAAMLSALVGVVSAAVQTVFYAVYYYDVRIRREGFDLEMALQRLAAQPS